MKPGITARQTHLPLGELPLIKLLMQYMGENSNSINSSKPQNYEKGSHSSCLNKGDSPSFVSKCFDVECSTNRENEQFPFDSIHVVKTFIIEQHWRFTEEFKMHHLMHPSQ